MKLSVIILNYNVRYFLELCLKSVQDATKNLDAEIIVVDNKSEDESCQMVKDLFPDVILIENDDNYGFSKGNNIGVKKAKGEYVCILNPDTVVPEDIFENLLAFSEDKKDLGIVGCKLVNGRGKFLPESKRNIPYVKVALKKFLGNTEQYYVVNPDENSIGKVDVLVGAFMFIKRETYWDIGGFDEDYFMYGEDIDLSYKAIKSGYQNYYLGTSSIIHYKGESTLRDKLYAKRFYGAMQIFYKKHFNKNILYNAMVWLGIIFAYFTRTISVSNNKTIKRYVLISDKTYASLEKALGKTLVSEAVLEDSIQLHSEIIFDANFKSNKEIINTIEKNSKNIFVTYKILVKDSNFIIGSDNVVCRGEIVKF